MQLRRSYVAGLAGLGDHLTAFDRVALLDQDFAGVSIGRDETVAVTNQQEIAVAFKLVAGVSDDTILGSLHRCAFRDGEIDAVILQAVRLGSEACDDAATYGPAEGGQTAGRLRGLDGILLAF